MKLDPLALKVVLASSRIPQWRLARLLNISEADMSHIMTGRKEASLATIKHISQALKIDPALLVECDASPQAALASKSARKPHLGKKAKNV